jgi:hypothetical protein
MDSENKSKKKESWFERLTRNMFKKENDKSQSPELPKELPKVLQDPQRTQELIQNTLLVELTKFKVGLTLQNQSKPEMKVNVESKKTSTPLTDEFDIQRFDQQYQGINIVNPPMTSRNPHAANESQKKKEMLVSQNNSDPEKSVIELRKGLLEELKRLKQVVTETKVETKEDLEQKNLLKNKLMSELKQFKESIKDSATDEEKKILLETDWEQWD